MARLVLDRVSKTFTGPKKERIDALDEISLAVEDRELFVLVGPSGSGKSTLLRVIAGLEKSSSGSISMAGAPLGHLPPQERDIAMVFQSLALYPHMTVRENIAFPLMVRKTPGAEVKARVVEAAEMLGLVPLLDRHPAALSGGERQRVALGRAVVRRPKLFLFDEPLSNLDAPMRAEMRMEIARLHRELGTTMIYVTHDQGEAMTLGQRAAVLHRGKIQQVGEPLVLYRCPENLFVAGFIGSPSINLFRGRILADNSGGFQFHADPVSEPDFKLPIPASLSSRLDGFAGREVLLGLRPEQIRQAAAGADGGGNCIVAAVERIEALGPETYLYARIGGTRIVARLPAEADVRAGGVMKLAFDLEKLQMFDPVSTRVLL